MKIIHTHTPRIAERFPCIFPAAGALPGRPVGRLDNGGNASIETSAISKLRNYRRSYSILSRSSTINTELLRSNSKLNKYFCTQHTEIDVLDKITIQNKKGTNLRSTEIYHKLDETGSPLHNWLSADSRDSSITTVPRTPYERSNRSEFLWIFYLYRSERWTTEISVYNTSDWSPTELIVKLHESANKHETESAQWQELLSGVGWCTGWLSVPSDGATVFITACMHLWK